MEEKTMNSNEFIEVLKLFEEATSNASDNIKACISELMATTQHQELNNKVRKVAEDAVREAKKKYPKITDNKPNESNDEKCDSFNESPDIITRRMYNVICAKLPIFKACTTLSADGIKLLYDFINTYKVIDKPVSTCGNTDIYRKYIFRSKTPNDCRVCMCVDMGPMYQCAALQPEYANEHGMHINFTISTPKIVDFTSIYKINKILNENVLNIDNMRLCKVESQNPHYDNYELSMNAKYCELCDHNGDYRMMLMISKVIIAIMNLFMSMTEYVASLECRKN